MTTTDDKELIARIQAGDTAAYRETMKRYGTPICTLTRRIGGSREDAEELTQDVFLKAFDRIGRYRGESSFSTWLYRIAYNCAVSKYRKRKREMPFADETAQERIPDTNAPWQGEDASGKREALLSALETALSRLPTEEAMIVSLFYTARKSVEELADITGYSASNIKVKLHRIRRKLGTLIENIQTTEL